MNKVHFILILTPVICCLSQALGSEHWRKPARVTGLIDDTNTSAPFLSFDGKTLYFKSDREEPNMAKTRFYTATRTETNGAFTAVKELTEFNDALSWCKRMPDGRTLCYFAPSPVAYVWVSMDNLRMYYTVSELGSDGINMTARNSESEGWHRGGANIFNERGVSRLSLTGDEMEFVGDGAVMRLKPKPPFWPPRAVSGDIFISVRGNTADPFGIEDVLAELDSPRVEAGPFLSLDGSNIYFSSDRDGNDFKLFKATKAGGQAVFANLEKLDDLSIPGEDVGCPALSADEQTIYFEVHFKTGPQAGRAYIYDSERINTPAELSNHLIEHAITEKQNAIAGLMKAESFELEAIENLETAQIQAESKRQSQDFFRAKILVGISILKNRAAEKSLQESLEQLEKALEF